MGWPTTSQPHSPSPLPEASSGGRDAVFTATALPLLPAVHRLARMLVEHDADAEDVVQETFLRAYRYWHTFQPGTDCRRWLATICRRVAHDLHRRARQVDVVDDAELESLAATRLHAAAVAAGLGDMYTRVDLGAAIRRAMATLDPAFREVVVLSDVEGFSYQEIAETLDIPLGTVRSRLYRGRRHLQEALMAYALDAGYGPARTGSE